MFERRNQKMNFSAPTVNIWMKFFDFLTFIITSGCNYSRSRDVLAAYLKNWRRGFLPFQRWNMHSWGERRKLYWTWSHPSNSLFKTSIKCIASVTNRCQCYLPEKIFGHVYGVNWRLLRYNSALLFGTKTDWPSHYLFS